MHHKNIKVILFVFLFFFFLRRVSILHHFIRFHNNYHCCCYVFFLFFILATTPTKSYDLYGILRVNSEIACRLTNKETKKHMYKYERMRNHYFDSLPAILTLSLLPFFIQIDAWLLSVLLLFVSFFCYSFSLNCWLFFAILKKMIFGFSFCFMHICLFNVFI